MPRKRKKWPSEIKRAKERKKAQLAKIPLNGKPTAVDRGRWVALKHDKITIEEIALRENVPVAAIQKSVDKMENYRRQHSAEMVNIEVNALTMNMLPKLQRSLVDGLGAKIIVRGTNQDGKSIVVSQDPDHDIRSKARQQLIQLTERTLPKSTGVNVNVAQLNQQSQETVIPHGRSFEERIRVLREQRGLMSDNSASDVIDGDVDDDEDDESEEAEGEAAHG